MNPLIVTIDIGGIWYISYFVGFVFLILSIGLIPTKKRDKFVANDLFFLKLLFVYTLLRSLLLSHYPYQFFNDATLAVRWTAAQVAIELLMFYLFYEKCSENLVKIILKYCYPLIIGINLLLVFFNGYGLLNAQSFDLALCAASLPLMPKLIQYTIVALCVTRHGNTALMILLTQFIGYVFKTRRYIKFTPVVFALAFVSSYYFRIGDITLGTGRTEAYKRFMSVWLENDLITKLFGFGSGSFIWLAMEIDKYKSPIFFQLHSDWLQIIFELGLVGFTLTVLSYAACLKKAYYDTKLFCTVLGLGAFGLTYHPTRYFLSAFLIVLVLVLLKNPQDKK